MKNILALIHLFNSEKPLRKNVTLK